jgi:hypothetical protein
MIRNQKYNAAKVSKLILERLRAWEDERNEAGFIGAYETSRNEFASWLECSPSNLSRWIKKRAQMTADSARVLEKKIPGIMVAAGYSDESEDPVVRAINARLKALYDSGKLSDASKQEIVEYLEEVIKKLEADEEGDTSIN